VFDRQKIMEAVRELRAHTGLTQTQFAGRIGVSMSSLQGYEAIRPPKGKRLTTLLKLAQREGRPDLADVFQAALAEELESVPQTEQETTCAHCSARLYVDSEGSSKVVEPGLPLKSEQDTPRGTKGVQYSSDTLEWAELASQAGEVIDPFWKEMFQSVKKQLTLIAKQACAEKGLVLGDPRRRDTDGTKKPLRDGKADKRAVRHPGRKTG
jgi:transcriptional regulator with XRE-family HTH domain